MVNIHIKMLPKLAGLSDTQADNALEELSRHNFYDDDNEPFLTKWENKNWSISKVLLWECRRCVGIEREFISPAIRAEVLSIGICVHCGTKQNLEVDHIKPIALGGNSGRENLQPLCSRCNRRKRDRFIG